jgi:hypothetical protein
MSNDQYIDANNHTWVTVRNEEGKILYSYDLTDIEYKRSHLEHIINPFEFEKLLMKNSLIMSGDLCPDCENEPCECDD